MEENRPYIKKPLNAFMVFMREHRPFIDEDVKRKGNGVVNMHLAQTVGRHFLSPGGRLPSPW